jgi:hypothetical protein
MSGFRKTSADEPTNPQITSCSLRRLVHRVGAASAEELAKLAQNSIANLISVPFQNNTNYNVGTQNGTQNILNIEPVIRSASMPTGTSSPARLSRSSRSRPSLPGRTATTAWAMSSSARFSLRRLRTA